MKKLSPPLKKNVHHFFNPWWTYDQHLKISFVWTAPSPDLEMFRLPGYIGRLSADFLIALIDCWQLSNHKTFNSLIWRDFWLYQAPGRGPYFKSIKDTTHVTLVREVCSSGSAGVIGPGRQDQTVWS